MQDNDGTDAVSRVQGIQMIPVESESSIMEHGQHVHYDENLTRSFDELKSVTEQYDGEMIISPSKASLCNTCCKNDAGPFENQCPVVEMLQLAAGDKAEDSRADAVDASFDANKHPSQPIERCEEPCHGITTDSALENHCDQEISRCLPDRQEQLLDRTEGSEDGGTTPSASPSLGLLHEISASDLSREENHLNASSDIHASCYYETNVYSRDDKHSSLPSLQWFPLTTASTQSDLVANGISPSTPRISSGDDADLSESRGNPIYPVLATPIHEPTTISARLVHDHYPKLYSRCARACVVKRKRRILWTSLCFLLIAIILSLVGVYFGIKKKCSHICYEEVLPSMRIGWSPSLCPLAKCYANSRAKFMGYWQVWCSMNYSKVQKCSDVIIPS